jgi:putative FmdB family regulatory protein
MAPKYNYKCYECLQEFEKEISYKKDSNKNIKCPKCKKSKNVKKIIKSFAPVHYSIYGFYNTDNHKPKDYTK